MLIVNGAHHRPFTLKMCLRVDVSNPTSLVLFSIPGIPGSHQLTGVVLISMDRGQNILAAMNEKPKLKQILKYSRTTSAF